MIEVLPQSHDATVGIRASGVLKHIDYEQTLIPLLDKTIAKHRRVRLVVEIADNFAGWELPAVWDDANFGLTHRADLAKDCARRRPEMGRLGDQTVCAVHRRRVEHLPLGEHPASLELDRRKLSARRRGARDIHFWLATLAQGVSGAMGKALGCCVFGLLAMAIEPPSATDATAPPRCRLKRSPLSL